MKKSKLLITIISFAICLSYYWVVNRYVPVEAYSNINVGSQWQDNVSHALAFIHRRASPEIVVVGSSLTARVPVGMESHGEIHNLAFGGDGPLTGLKIILESRWRPPLVGIEVNMIGLPENSRLLDRLTGFRAIFFDKYLPFTMEWYSPPRAFLYWKKYEAYQSRNVLDDRPPQAVLSKLIEQQLADYQNHQFHDAGNSIKDVVDTAESLKRDGSKVFFYLCPIEPVLLDTPRAIAAKMLFDDFAQAFPTLSSPDNSSFQTTDGIHLTEASAKKYAAYIIEKAQTLK